MKRVLQSSYWKKKRTDPILLNLEQEIYLALMFTT